MDRRTVGRIKVWVRLGNAQIITLLAACPLMALVLFIAAATAKGSPMTVILCCVMGAAIMLLWAVWYRPALHQVRLGKSILKDLQIIENIHLSLENRKEARDEG